jgi:sigma-E factor negative regulatory protein RseA
MNPLHENPLAVPHGDVVSALCDGELDEQALSRLLAADDGETQGRWHRYQLIGDVLRGHRAVLSSCPPSDFLDRLHAGLAADAPLARPAVVTVPEAPPARNEAANDGVFRWKMVSGFASVVAVASIGWNLLGATAPTGRGDAQLVQAAPTAPAATPAAAPVLVAAPTAEPRPVVVSTPQGRVIRDAALERLLAEHRQHGGMSAFQSSTGFIRNATYDADAR